MKKLMLAVAFITATLVANLSAATLDQKAVDEFIADMARDHGFDRAGLTALFAQAVRSERILELMTRPAEKVKPWYEYRKFFISDKRIRDGVTFWRDNQATLDRATQKYGVPADIIVAIIGVETSYGRVTGNHRVIDALATLAFHYPGDKPARSQYFRAQLEHFLLFARESDLDPLSVEGSYAGAMGMPQFMPENYRTLAVDFDGDGRRDIWKNAADAIGSVANYLSHHGWVRGGPIMSPARVGARGTGTFVQSDIQPESRLGDLAAAGIAPMVVSSGPDEKAALYEFEARGGTEYWIGYTNFYVVSRYNPRLKYTMAVAQLAASIRDLYEESAH